jgi:GNAT superfamily N-acetyltransferase
VAEGRLATASDIDALISLRAVQFGVDERLDVLWVTNARERLRVGLASGTLAAAVVEDEGTPVASGVALITWHLPSPSHPDGRIGHIHSMFTEPAARRRGYGRQILQLLLHWLWDTGVQRVELNTSVEGRALYESRGFSSTGDDRLRLDLTSRP